MTTGMGYNRWEVWAADVKYEESATIKPRPVLVLADRSTHIVCLKMTKTAPQRGEYLLKDWQFVGLRYPTTVRIGKVLHMQAGDLKYKIGSLSPVDMASVQSMLANKLM